MRHVTIENTDLTGNFKGFNGSWWHFAIKNIQKSWLNGISAIGDEISSQILGFKRISLRKICSFQAPIFQIHPISGSHQTISKNSAAWNPLGWADGPAPMATKNCQKMGDPTNRKQQKLRVCHQKISISGRFSIFFVPRSSSSRLVFLLATYWSVTFRGAMLQCSSRFKQPQEVTSRTWAQTGGSPCWIFAILRTSVRRCVYKQKMKCIRNKSLLLNNLIQKERFLHLVQALADIDQADLRHFLYLDQTQRDLVSSPNSAKKHIPSAFSCEPVSAFLSNRGNPSGNCRSAKGRPSTTKKLE